MVMVGNAQLVPKGIKAVELKSVVKFTNDLKARDKLLRLAQYATKILVFRLKQQDPKSDLGKRIELLSKGIGLHRKAFKFGAWIDEIEKIKELLASGKEDLKTKLSLVLRACMTVFVVLDNLVWLASLKVVDLDKDGFKMKAYKFRLVAAILNTAVGVLDFQKQEKAIEKAQPAELAKAQEKQGSNVVGLVKNVFDVVTYMNSAKYIELVAGSALNDDVVGLVGSISSIAALYGIWIK